MRATAGPAVRRGTALALGAVWWWAVLRLMLSGDAGVLEGAITAGGWGLSLLPVHCVPKGAGRAGGATTVAGEAGWVADGAVVGEAGEAGGAADGAVADGAAEGAAAGPGRRQPPVRR
ncbi:hypothetical protein [Streptomyces similanensis]|uniref:Uncharacterized protein n=1 Tax=Streptomyces similanensis TaxID=1274988 RepID=A0ABP9LCQ3_9ACTN